MTSTFDYGIARVRDLGVRRGPSTAGGLPTIADVEFQGEQLRPSKRFLHSFSRRFLVSDNVFRYFSHEEVFARITEQAPDESFRYCIERRADAPDRLLAVSNPSRPVIAHDEIANLVTRYEAQDVRYADGVVTSEHIPQTGDFPVTIGSDEFRQRFVLDTPIDGYGTPRIHLSMLRMICSNGMVGYTKAFRSEISVGNDVAYAIARAMDSFDNRDGYAALQQRFDSAQRSWASIRETEELYRVLLRMKLQRNHGRQPLLNDYYNVTGRVQELYGLANLDALSSKRQRVLPAKCRVYDLINFASEVGTHYATPAGNRDLQVYIGNVISDEYDLEGTGDSVSEFNDFFVSRN